MASILITSEFSAFSGLSLRICRISAPFQQRSAKAQAHPVPAITLWSRSASFFAASAAIAFLSLSSSNRLILSASSRFLFCGAKKRQTVCHSQFLRNKLPLRFPASVGMFFTLETYEFSCPPCKRSDTLVESTNPSPPAAHLYPVFINNPILCSSILFFVKTRSNL